MGQPLNGRSNYDAFRQFHNILSDAGNVSLGTTLGRLGEWSTYAVPDAARINAEVFDPYRGLTPEGRVLATQLDRLEGGTISGIATGVSIQLGASAATQDLVHGLASSADGILLSGAAFGGATIRPFIGQNSLVDPAWDAPLAGVRANQLAGFSREALVRAELEAQYPGASIQNEVYLRSANGDRAIDPLSGESRRIDSVVVQDGRVLDAVEVTSQTANKTAQILKEQSIRNNGGTFITDRATGQLIDISQVPTRIVRKP